ncbi:hypothetical protein ABEB36_013638 [Hypothenemus hampei]|uniref:Transposable element P transposase n=1 Tax=Hypothenemus hampei TaxID=57062 RepID=A0ABD1E4U6_HYPHA
MVASKELPSDAIYTAEFVELMDQFFDSLNSKIIHKSHVKPSKAGASLTSPHLSLWTDLCSKVDRWSFINKYTGALEKRPQGINGLNKTLRGFTEIVHLLNRKGITVRTRSFQQDALENLFSQVRQYGRANTMLIALQFISSMKTVLVNNLTTSLL